MSGALQALVFNVQRFSVHDGPGIRTTVFFKGCPLRCRWCQNPESLRPAAEVAWHSDRCQGSQACGPACPQDAIQLDGGVPRLDRARCDGCGACADACASRAFEVVGRRVGVEELLAEVQRDAPFYESSGGGVTLSGGEATSQAAFVLAFTRRCVEEGLRVGLQTCGATRWETLEELLPSLAFVQFDLKVADPGRHRALTSSSNQTIIDNARRLLAAGADVTFRTPLVPGHNDSPEDLQELAALLHSMGVDQLQLLPYHALGLVKNDRLGRPLEAFDPPTSAQVETSLEAATSLLLRHGVTTR